MSKRIIYGFKEFQENYIKRAKRVIESEKAVGNIIEPKLSIIQFGDRPDSNKYILQKAKHCEAVGIETTINKFSESQVYSAVDLIDYNNKNGIYTIIQQPFPDEIKSFGRFLINKISPTLDVDGLCDTNLVGLLLNDHRRKVPCTASAVIRAIFAMLPHCDTLPNDLNGVNILILGRSFIVGRPLSIILSTKYNATVTLANSYTDLEDVLNRKYDIIISATGSNRLKNVSAPMLIDVSINFDSNGKMCGDFDLDNCDFDIATPVPNGIGRLTVVEVINNILMDYDI